MKKRIAVIDPSSYTLPYDYFFIQRISSARHVDFYCSFTRYNWEFAQHLAKNDKVKIIAKNISGQPKLKGGMAYFLLLLRLWQNRSQYDWIHFQWQILPGPLAFLEIVFMWLIRKKLVFTCHNPTPHSKWNEKAYWVFKWIRKIACQIIFVSEFSKKRFEEIYEATNNTLVIQHGLLPISPTEPLGESLEIENQNGVCFNRDIVFWGNVKPYKGVSFLADMMKEKADHLLSFHVYGKWDPGMEQVRKQLDTAGIHVKDHFLSENELRDVLLCPSIFIFPYRNISQSGVLYTYLYYGCVCISTDIGDNASFFRRHHLEKLLFKPGDVPGAMQALDYATSRFAELKEKMKTIKRLYQWDIVIPDPLAIYPYPAQPKFDRVDKHNA